MDIIKDLNLNIKKGETLLITGASGIGKSTFFNLLMRLYDPTSGDISVDGQNIKDLKFSFRDKFSLCAQNHIFFNDSILNNLRIADINKFYKEEKTTPVFIKTKDRVDKFVPRETEPEEEIIQLCKDLNIYKRITEFKEKFDYVVGEAGNKLSGGERQRLNLVRCLLKDADVYLFDEPTNFLDSFNKKMFIDKLQDLRQKGKTLLIISHNLELDEIADHVLCIKKNGENEYGTVKQLMEEDTYYKRLKEVHPDIRDSMNI